MNTPTHLVDPGTLSPAELDQLMAPFDAGIDWEDAALHTFAGIQPLLQYLYALSFSGRNEEAVVVSSKIKSCLDDALAAQSDSEELLECMVTLNQLSGRFFAVFHRDIFTDFAYYQTILNHTEGKAGRFWVEDSKAKIGLLQSYVLWQKQGGQPQLLPEDQIQFLNELEAGYIPQIEQDLEAVMQTEMSDAEINNVLDVKRALATYFFAIGKPNDSIRVRKQILADMDELQVPPVAEKADVNLELGAILMQYQKYKGALPYLQAAHALYVQAGDEFEPFALQAESLTEDCQAHL